ncbi:MAG: hypothetical protein ACP5NS_01445 [Candidatus Pacearchaeota archaeon]
MHRTFEERFDICEGLIESGKELEVLANGSQGIELHCTATSGELLYPPLRATRIILDKSGRLFEQSVTFDEEYQRSYGPLLERKKAELRKEYPIFD